MINVHVIIPSKKGNKEQGERCAKMVRLRAGDNINVTALVVEDLNNEHFFGILNRVEKTLRGKYDWLVYCPDDYFPGRDFLSIALHEAKNHNKLFVCFNDGKWHGNNATAGMIHFSIVPNIYDSKTLFHTAYKSHGADPDLTARMKQMGQFLYVPTALLVEVDYHKDLKNLKSNPEDIKLYWQRHSEGFPK
jgi:hypothetical protein